MSLLPPIVDVEAFEAVRKKDIFGPGLKVIAERHGLPAEAPQKPPRGSLPVFYWGEYVIKLYPNIYSDEAQREQQVLGHLAGKLPFLTPLPVASGVLDTWDYLVMGRLPGLELKELWDDLSFSEKTQLLTDLGAGVAQMHQLSPPVLAAPPWHKFIAERRAEAYAHHQKKNMPAPWLAELEGYLDSLRLPDKPLALLHTELMPDHTLVRKVDGRFKITGIFDFEPALVGHPEYEFASVGLFFGRGQPGLLSAFLSGYGAKDPQPPGILAMALLHRYSNFSWYRQFMPNLDDGPLQALAQGWFPVK